MAEPQGISDLVKDRIGSFKITRSLGAGLMGEVFQGTETSVTPPIYYAIKVVNPKVARKTDSAILFEKEIADDNIMKIQIKPDPKLGFYFLMDYLEVRPLTHKSTRPRGHTGLLDLFQTISKALAKVHAKGVIHGNLKATNLLVRRAGKDLMPFISDFGLDYVWDKDYFAGDRFTEAFASMAPERIAQVIPGSVAGSPAPGPAADVYSLAVVLCDALTGKRLFGEAESLEDLLERKRDPRFQLIAVTHPSRKIDIKGLNDLIGKSLAFDAGKRPKTVQAFAEALEACRVPPDKMVSKE
ncbi:MAG: protein kinase [Planctomycetes bacterium]|jgi:serine/threonine protein kinase|nr:protein kinase [Planctomycetota bacterium]